MVDEQISIAIKTRESLISQRNTIKAIQTQLTTLASMQNESSFKLILLLI